MVLMETDGAAFWDVDADELRDIANTYRDVRCSLFPVHFALRAFYVLEPFLTLTYSNSRATLSSASSQLFAVNLSQQTRKRIGLVARRRINPRLHLFIVCTLLIT